jgi:hypothetical protein
VLELQVGDVATVLYPSDLADLGLTDAEAAELYDNLVFHGYLDSDGQVLLDGTAADAPGARTRRGVTGARRDHHGRAGRISVPRTSSRPPACRDLRPYRARGGSVRLLA